MAASAKGSKVRLSLCTENGVIEQTYLCEAENAADAALEIAKILQMHPFCDGVNVFRFEWERPPLVSDPTHVSQGESS
jgi:hypothetical protein